jgi:hypothetical protein
MPEGANSVQTMAASIAVGTLIRRDLPNLNPSDDPS